VFEAFCKEKLGPLALRLALGLFYAYHGYIKIMAAGGTAWNPSLPVFWQVLIAWGQFCAGVAILLGFRCRWAATLVLVHMVATAIWSQGWKVIHVTLADMQITLFFVLTGLALLFLGAGQLSLDARSGGKFPSRK
jgi:uncharacterized membrane protein YphA (DoxX/SURF4 family)